MKSIIVLALISLSLISCNKGDDSGPAQDPIVGTWYYINPASTSTSEIGLIAYVKADGSYSSISYKATQQTSGWTAFIRKSIGTYTRSGNTFTINYTYETCSPIKTETFTATISATNNNQLIYVSGDKTVAANFTRSTGSSSEPVNFTLTEDTGCNKF